MVQSITGNNLKIVLTAAEVSRLFGNDTIDFKNEKTARIIDGILSHAARVLHFDLPSERVIVEIFKKKNGVGIIYFLDVCRNLKKEAVLEFLKIDDLITATELLKNTEFSFYHYNGKYRIVAKLNKDSTEMINRMCEFSRIYFEKEQIAKTEEYGVKKV